MNAIIYLLVAVAIAAWIRHSLLSVPTSVPAPKIRRMRGMPDRPAFATTERGRDAMGASGRSAS